MSRLLLLLALSAAAQADSNPLVEAKHHYEQATRKYDLGQFQDAAHEFERAFELCGDPTLLFNIAQSYRLDKNYESALKFYRSYLRRSEHVAQRPEIERRIVELTAIVAHQNAETQAPPQGLTRQPEVSPAPEIPKPPVAAMEPPVAATRPPAAKPVRASRRLIWVSVGVSALAVAALATGISLAALSSSDANQLHDASAMGQTFTPSWQALENNGRSYSAGAIAGFTIAGACAVAAITSLVLSRRAPRADRSWGKF